MRTKAGHDRWRVAEEASFFQTNRDWKWKIKEVLYVLGDLEEGKATQGSSKAIDVIEPRW